MTDLPFVATKLAIPSLNPRWVNRPRLMALLDSGRDRRLTLLSAAPGSGKTTALAQYCAQRGNIAWLGLDAADADPARFAAGIAAAVERVIPGGCPGTAALLTSPADATPAGLAATLANDLARVSRLTIVLDDFHLVGSDGVSTLVAALIDQLPEQVRLIIATQVDPALPLARLRAAGQLCPIRGTDLRFGGREAASFIRQTMRLDLPTEVIALLETKTEGWAAGLQLAALALAAGTVSGGHRYVFDYLAEEVFRSCPAPTRDFLLSTCPLDRMCGSLCDAVTGGTDGQEMLERLELSNLFVVPLDAERRWYRYHQLFGEFLHRQLTRERETAVAGICGRAAEWHQCQGDAESALQYWLRAGEYDTAGDIMEACAPEALSRGEISRLLGWTDALPSAVLTARPRLGLANAWALLIGRGPGVGLDAQLTALEQGMAGRDIAAEQAEILTIRASAALLTNQPGLSVELASGALVAAAPDDWHLRSLTSLALARAAWQTGAVVRATEAFAQAAEYGRHCGRKNLAAGALFNLARLETLRGKLATATDIFDEAMALATANGGAHLPVTGLGHVWYAQTLLELNRLDEARHEAEDGLAGCRPTGNGESVVHALVTLAQVVSAEGNAGLAGELAEQATAEAAVVGGAALHCLAEAARVHVALARGDKTAAQRWVAGATPAGVTSPQRIFEQVTWGRALLATGHTDTAVRHLGALQAAADESACPGWAARVRVPLALGLLTAGENGQAAQLIRLALKAAEQDGFRRALLDQGPALARLEALLAATEARQLRAFTAASAISLPIDQTLGGLVELSARELEVLRLMAAGLSNQAIAEQLVVTEGTAKWHVHNILSKLNVSNRTQALARARELRILS